MNAAGRELLAAAAYLGEPDLAVRIREEMPEDDDHLPMRRMLAVVAAFFAAGPRRCAAALEALQEVELARFNVVVPSLLVFGRELLRQGHALGPEWRAPIAQPRAYLERARATWFLVRLEELAAAVRD